MASSVTAAATAVSEAYSGVDAPAATSAHHDEAQGGDRKPQYDGTRRVHARRAGGSTHGHSPRHVSADGASDDVLDSHGTHTGATGAERPGLPTLPTGVPAWHTGNHDRAPDGDSGRARPPASPVGGVQLIGALATADRLFRRLTPSRDTSWWRPSRVVPVLFAVLMWTLALGWDMPFFLKLSAEGHPNRVFVLASGVAYLIDSSLLLMYAASKTPGSVAVVLERLNLPVGSVEHTLLLQTARRWGVALSMLWLFFVALFGTTTVASALCEGDPLACMPFESTPRVFEGWWRNKGVGGVTNAFMLVATTSYKTLLLFQVAVGCRAVQLHVRRFQRACCAGGGAWAADSNTSAPVVSRRWSPAPVQVSPAVATDGIGIERGAGTVRGEHVDAGAPHNGNVGGNVEQEPTLADSDDLPLTNIRNAWVSQVRRPIARIDEQLNPAYMLMAVGSLVNFVLLMLPVAAALARSHKSDEDQAFAVVMAFFSTIHLSGVVAFAVPAAHIQAECVRLADNLSLTAGANPPRVGELTERGADVDAPSVGTKTAQLSTSEPLSGSAAAALEHAVALSLRFCGLRVLGHTRMTFDLVVRVSSVLASVTLLWVNQERGLD